MYTIDIINLVIGIWVVPMIIFFVILSIVNSSFVFSASRSHWFLACSLIITVFVFGAKLWLPTLDLAIVPHSLRPLTQITIPSQSGIVYAGIVSYTLITFWIISFQVIGLFEVFFLTKRAHRLDSEEINSCISIANTNREIVVKESDEIQSPVMWGVFSPVILLPSSYKEWDDARFRRVMAHELAHVQRADWLIKVVCKICCAIFWSVPLVWYIAKRIEWYAELASDDMVVANTDCRAEYAEDLLTLASEKKKSDWFMNFVRSSALFERIRYVLDGRSQRDVLSLPTKFCYGLVATMLMLPLVLIHATPMPLYLDLSAGIPVHVPESNKNSSTSQAHDVDIRYYLPDVHYTSSQPPEKPRFQEDMLIISRPDLSSMQGLVDSTEITMARVAVPTVDVKGLLPERMVTPVYPRKAIDREIEGQVIVQFDIDQQGNVINPRVVSSQPSRIFDSAVLRALKQSKYRPMEIEGQPIKVKNVTETFSFKLFESSADKPTAVERPNQLKTVVL